MSVVATIEDPIDKPEAKFNVPICTERFYIDVIRPIAVRRSLELLLGWGTMTCISVAEFPAFFKELDILEAELLLEHHVYAVERLASLTSQIKALELREDLVLLIG
jgi:hypothetical protein